MVIKAKTLVRN